MLTSLALVRNALIANQNRLKSLLKGIGYIEMRDSNRGGVAVHIRNLLAVPIIQLKGY